MLTLFPQCIIQFGHRFSCSQTFRLGAVSQLLRVPLQSYKR